MQTLAAPLDPVDYVGLYRRWEHQQWRATDIDFSVDRIHWNDTLTDEQRRALLWNFSMFLHGEQSVAENLSPYIDAAPRAEQKHFLATQQADEARHAVFFGRFFDEVVEAGDSFAALLDSTSDALTWGFRKVFERLDRLAGELREDPSTPMLARGIMLYHLIVESAIAQPGQQFIERSLEQHDTLPGFLAGMRHVARDEQRHIGFGVKLLAELIENPACRSAALELMREVLPYSSALYVPPGWDRSYTEAMGFTLEDIYAAADRSIITKLRTAGFTDDELTSALNVRVELEPEQRASELVALLKAGVLGEKLGPPSTDPRTVELLFRSIELAVDPSAAPRSPFTVQWDFVDADPWFIRVGDGSAHAVHGNAERPDLRFTCRFEDWVDVAVGREDPTQLMMRRRIRPHGLRMLWKSRNLFG